MFFLAAFLQVSFTRSIATTKPSNAMLGDYTAGETPLPIPNREVKPRRADGTARVTVWESRSLPSSFVLWAIAATQ